MPIARRRFLESASAAVAISAARSAQAGPAPLLGVDPHGFLRVLLVNFKDGTRPDDYSALAAPFGEGKTVKGFLSAPNIAGGKIGGFAWGTDTAYADAAGYNAAKKAEAAHLRKFANSCELLVDKPFSWINPAQAGATIYDRHHVLIRFKDGVDEDRQQRVIAYIKGRIVGHPHIQAVVMGKNILPRSDTSPYDWLAVNIYASEEDHRSQQNDPERQAATAVEFLPFADVLNFDCKG